MKKFKKKTILIIVISLIVVSLVSIATAKTVMKPKNDGNISVKTTKIQKQDIESNIVTSGTVVSKEVKQITSDITGKIKEVLVEEGEKVKKNQVLLKLDSSDIEYRLKKAEIDLQIAKDKLEELRKEDRANLETIFKNSEIKYNDELRNYKDQKSLNEAGAISKEELEKAKSNMQRAKNDYELAKKKYEDAENQSEIKIQEKRIKALEIEIKKHKEDLEKSDIISPIEGTVTDAEALELNVIGENTILFIIQDIDNLEVTTNISEYDISKINIGQVVKITGEGVGDKEYEGIVKYISPNAEIDRNGQSTETVVEVKIEIKDKNTGFKPNFSANIEINTAKKKDALIVPYEVLYSEKDGTKVIFTVEDGKAKRNVIETGIESDMVVEVMGESIKEGDMVILSPNEGIKDGTVVDVNRGMKE